MRNFCFALALTILPVTAAIAHPDHDMDEPEDRSVEQLAKDHVIKLVSQAKLPASWAKAKPQPTQNRRVRGRPQSVVAFRNDAEPQARRLFYVVLASDGAVVSADYILR